MLLLMASHLTTMKSCSTVCVAYVSCLARCSMVSGPAAGFRTDSDISGNYGLRERNLQPWEPSTATEIDMSLEGPGGSWDQFQANEKRFGLKSDYNEDIYTTSIDKSHPDYRRREVEAMRIAQEIERGQADNAHVREERGASQPEDVMDEEDK